MFKKKECEFFLKSTANTAWTRLYNLGGTEWELPEDDALTSKQVAAINKKQYNKLFTIYRRNWILPRNAAWRDFLLEILHFVNICVKN
jgi:hypothetical protein